MKRLAIIGSGDLGQLITHHANTDNHYNIIGFFDDFKNTNDFVDSYPILGCIDDVEKLFKRQFFDHIIVAIGYNHMILLLNHILLYLHAYPLPDLVRLENVVILGLIQQ